MRDQKIYNFDEEVNRVGSNCLKYDFRTERGYDEDTLPLWVADMDFRVADPITKALQERVDHGIYGYDDTKDDYVLAVASWFERHFDWKIEKDWLVKTPGVVYALALAVRAFTNKHDAVMIQQPVYYPFGQVIVNNGRKIVNNALRLVDGQYEMDFEDMEHKIVSEHVKLMFLCSPHNPGGIVWTKETLQRLADICLKHGVIVVSDEIHCDFAFEPNRHTVFASLSKRISEQCLILTAPSKTFNIAGLQVSNVFIANPHLREKFIKELDATGYSQLNNMGLIAAKAAYEDGENWLKQLKGYLWENYLYLKQYIEEHIPQIKVTQLQGTYLVWLDCRNLYSDRRERNELIKRKAGLWLSEGIVFGEEGRGFERLNLACTRKTLKTALQRWKEAINSQSV